MVQGGQENITKKFQELSKISEGHLEAFREPTISNLNFKFRYNFKFHENQSQTIENH